jgi:hypothetical protein
MKEDKRMYHLSFKPKLTGGPEGTRTLGLIIANDAL